MKKVSLATIALVLLAATLLSTLPLIAVSNAASVSSGTTTVKLYLQQNTAVTTENTISTSGYVFATKEASAGVDLAGANGNLNVHFFLAPPLAGSLSLSGSVIITVYARAQTTAVSGVTYVTALSEASPTGAETLLGNTSSSISLGTTNSPFSNTLTISQTVPAGDILDLHLRLFLASQTQQFIASVGYASTAPSNIAATVVGTVTASISVSPSSVSTDPVTFSVIVSDVFGAYDIASAPSMVVTDPHQSLPSASTTQSGSNTLFDGYANNLQTTWTYSMTPFNTVDQSWTGTWQGTVSVTDQSGNKISVGTIFYYDFGGYGQTTTNQPGVSVGERTFSFSNPILGVIVILLLALVVVGIAHKARRK